jgi:hypothetical protein
LDTCKAWVAQLVLHKGLKTFNNFLSFAALTKHFETFLDEKIK